MGSGQLVSNLLATWASRGLGVPARPSHADYGGRREAYRNLPPDAAFLLAPSERSCPLLSMVLAKSLVVVCSGII